MLKIIKAEFENFDYAELASRKIRKNIDGIRKIRIASQNQHEYNSPKHYFRLLPTAVTTQNYITGTVISDSTAAESRLYRKSSFLTIICNEESAAHVHSIITACGGLSVSTDTFLPS